MAEHGMSVTLPDLSEYLPELDEANTLHVWPAWDGQIQSEVAYCGVTYAAHGCHSAKYPGMSPWLEEFIDDRCPGCGKRVCAFCRFLCDLRHQERHS